MILFDLYVTTAESVALARNITIKGNHYCIDIYTEEYLKEFPNEIQIMDIYKGHHYYSLEFVNQPIIEIG